MGNSMKITTATRSKLLQDTGFGAYDLCINPYVGCQFGCKYCYVRFFVKDEHEEWGNFVRTRDFLPEKLPKELQRVHGQRLVMGTMTDPYQPAEKEYRLTRTTLQILEQGISEGIKPKSIGIFTRSPLVLQDIDLLVKLDARVHVTMTPFDREILEKLEPIAIRTESRFELVSKLTQAGVRVHVSISPVLPIWSDHYVDEFVSRLVDAKPVGFTIDPMQVYGEALVAMDESCNDVPSWQMVREIVTNKKLYDAWKNDFHNLWLNAWKVYADLPILPISMDHKRKTRIDLRTNSRIDFQEFEYN